MRRPDWLTRNVIVLSGVSLLQDAASDLLYPLLPLYLSVQLGAPAVVIGAVEGVAEAVAAVTKLVSGRLADRMARRPLIGLGYGLAAVGKVLVAAATAWPVVLAGRAVDRVGKGMRGAPRDALLVTGVDPQSRGKVFGFHRAADTMGAVIGPLLALGGYHLLSNRSDLRPLFLIALVPAVLSVVLVAAVRETATARATAAAGDVDATGLSSAFWRALALLAVFALINFPDSLLLLRVSQLGAGVDGVILAYVLYNFVASMASYPAGSLSDRLAPPRVFAFGLVFFAIAYAGLGLATSAAAAFVLLPLYGIFAACTDGVGKTWMSRLAGSGRQGSAQGFYQGISGFGVLIAGIWAGLAWGDNGHVPLLVSGVAALVVAAGMFVTSGKRPA